MPHEITTLWTVEQTTLSALFIVCVVLIISGRRKLMPGAERDPAAASPAESSSCIPGPVDVTRAKKLSRRFLTVILVAVSAYLVYRGSDPLGVRPDSWSDANVIISGQNYARSGLLQHAGAAQHQVVTDTNPPDPFFRYTRYPVASNLINGLWQSAGITLPRLFRLLPAACSVAAVILWFGAFRRMGGYLVATVAAAAMALSYGFLSYADNLHFHAYAMLTSVAAMRCFMTAMEAGERGRLRWFLACRP